MRGDTLTNRTSNDRKDSDFYPTPNEATQALINFLNLPSDRIILEPACGDGIMSELFKQNGYEVISADIENRGYGEQQDFLTSQFDGFDWIITNPPFNVSEQFISKCIEYKKPFALLLKSQYWHSKKRFELFKKHRPAHVLPLTWRPDFLNGAKGGAPTMDCLWVVWNSTPSCFTNYQPLEKPEKR